MTKSRGMVVVPRFEITLMLSQSYIILGGGKIGGHCHGGLIYYGRCSALPIQSLFAVAHFGVWPVAVKGFALHFTVMLADVRQCGVLSPLSAFNTNQPFSKICNCRKHHDNTDHLPRISACRDTGH